MVSATATQWIGLIGALGGVFLTGLIGLATAVLNHRWQRAGTRDDRSHQAREARAERQRDAYARFLAARYALELFVMTQPPWSEADVTFGARVRRLREDDAKVFDEDDATLSLAELVASDRVREAISGFDVRWMEAYREAIESDEPEQADFDAATEPREAMVAAMRAEQADLLTTP